MVKNFGKNMAQPVDRCMQYKRLGGNVMNFAIIGCGVIAQTHAKALAQLKEEGCILYSEMLTDFERIGDHALNIAQEMTKMVIA